MGIRYAPSLGACISTWVVIFGPPGRSKEAEPAFENVVGLSVVAEAKHASIEGLVLSTWIVGGDDHRTVIEEVE